MGFYDGLSLKDMSNMDGVKDLPMAVRAKFIKALREEDKGNHTEAQAALDEAVAIEAGINTSK